MIFVSGDFVIKNVQQAGPKSRLSMYVDAPERIFVQA